MDALAEYGAAIRDARKARGLTLREVSAAGGPPISFLSEIERGKGNPSLTTIMQVHAALGVMPAALIPTEQDVFDRGFIAGHSAAVRAMCETPSAGMALLAYKEAR